jgi:uncharacterized protein YdcH (DUF465 family)
MNDQYNGCLKSFTWFSYEIFFGDPNMTQKSDDNGRPHKGLSIIKELKKKIKVLEEKRNTDRSMTTWQELKALKKQKLLLKDELNNDYT